MVENTSHEMTCECPRMVETILGRDASSACQYIISERIKVYNTKDRSSILKENKISSETLVDVRMWRLLARLPIQETRFCTNNVALFWSDLDEWSQASVVDSGNKMSSSAVRQGLVFNYPNRMDIPYEYHITSFRSVQLK